MFQTRSTRTIALAVSLAVLGAYGCDRERGGRQVRDPAGAVPRLAAATGAVLPLEAGPVAVRQCTRIVPTGVTGFWRPSRAEVDELEARLPAVVDSVLRLVHRGDSTRRDAGEYRRQYIGIARGPQRTIYVNAFLIEPLAGITRAARNPAPDQRHAARPDTLRWRTQPVDACDGGTRFFGVEYDPRGRTFGRIEFNERVSGPVRY